MACVELDGRILIVDVGLSFPSGDMPGIDLVLPDFDYVRTNAERVEAVVLTHGHEDHIGALAYLLREFDHLPVYGTPFTLALLKGKLEEHKVADRATLHTVIPGEGATVGPFSMRFLRVTHSIPDGMAVAIDTPHGTILHTGDFKIDQTPLDGRPTDLHGLAEEASGTGVHLLLSDSTNAEEAGYTSSERSVGPVVHADRRERSRDRGGGVFLQSHPPHPADRERCRRRRAGRCLLRVARCTTRSAQRASWACSRSTTTMSSTSRRSPHLDPGPGRRDLHGFAGRAVQRAVAHGRSANTSGSSCRSATPWCCRHR